MIEKLIQEVTLLSAYTSDVQYAYVRYSLYIYTLGTTRSVDSFLRFLNTTLKPQDYIEASVMLQYNSR